MHTTSAAPVLRADICVIGAGLIGPVNALQFARRGFTVASENRKFGPGISGNASAINITARQGGEHDTS